MHVGPLQFIKYRLDELPPLRVCYEPYKVTDAQAERITLSGAQLWKFIQQVGCLMLS